MNNKCIVISFIENLSLKENTRFTFFDWNISNNFEELMGIIPNPLSFFEGIGRIMMLALSQTTFAYKIHDLEKGENHGNILHSQWLELNSKLSLLWLYQDNSIFISKIFSQGLNDHYVGINQGDIILSNSRGLYERILFDDSFIEKIDADKLSTYVDLLFVPSNEIKITIPDSKVKGTSYESTYSSFSRIQRTFSLLQIARNTVLLPMKIGFYINALECLLVGMESELNFRLQVNTANFIGKTKDEKGKIRNIVKSAYDVRSKFFHGSIFKQKLDDLQSLSQELDGILRSAILEAVNKQDIINAKDTSKFDEYFKSILFS